MNKFTNLKSICISVREENIDTDQIVPARFLKITKREGFGQYLFYDWRFDKFGKPKKSVFNDPAYKKSEVLVAGNNFGCGSSREHAVWALLDFDLPAGRQGFKVVVSSSFGDIFYSNALKNGLLPVIISPRELTIMLKILDEKKLAVVGVDLLKQEIKIEKKVFHFPIDSFRKSCLLKGVDELGYILSFEKKIMKFEKNRTLNI